MTLDDAFATQPRSETERYTIGTVHSIKGETFMAVLLLAKHKGANGQIYESILNDRISTNEELRTVYVAITRPRKILVIAVPHSDIESWKTKFGIA